MKIFEKIIFWQFAFIFFLVPLILWPFTSEVFEFNKMVLVYFLTTLIAATWVVRMVYEKKFIFRRTILDIPLLVFLGSQLISTLFSIDPLTSWLGYYSRFNGGLVSTICYLLLYWAFVTHIDAKRTLNLIYVILASAALVSIYGVLEHFGIDKSVWVQDVASRVFSTLGQPNWLSAWLVALMPITWVFLIKSNIKSKSFWIYFLLSALYFWTLIFTKSRSGLLGFGVTFLAFWPIYFWVGRKELKKHIIPFVVLGSSLLTICLISGTQYSPSIASFIKHSASQPVAKPQGPVLETGGTESGSIRKIVWKGAVQVWLHYPIFGTGVETFAYSYYMFRPAEHNLTTEWDFIYNKAHNEFLNIAANSGTVGLAAYLVLIGFSIFQILKVKTQKLDNGFGLLNLALFSGYTSLLVTNFFGFSVVPTQLQFFLFPAIVVALTKEDEEKTKNQKVFLSSGQKTVIGAVLLLAFWLLILICRYWYADFLYSSGNGYKSVNKPDIAAKFFERAASLQPNQAIYLSDLAGSYANLALFFNQQKQTDQATQFSNLAITQTEKAVALSPANVNLKRTKFGVYVMLSGINPNYLIDAKNTLEAVILQAPTDAKIYYNLGLVYARTGQMDLALSTLKKTVELKANYKEARLAYAYVLIEKKENEAARDQLNYILTNIDPTDSLTKQTLESIK